MTSHNIEELNDSEQEAIASASHSIQSAISSILKPPFLDDDIKYATNKIFGDDGIRKYIDDGIELYAGSNMTAYRDLPAFRRTLFSFQRGCLQLLFEFYAYYLTLTNIGEAIYLVFSRFFWGFIVLINIFPNDFDGLDYVLLPPSPDRDSLNSSTLTLASTEDWNESITNYFSISLLRYYYSRLTQIPVWMGNYALYKSIEGLPPTDKGTIIKSIGRRKLPNNVAIIFEMPPLVIAMPPEVPTPYLTADKKLVVPDPKETSDVLSARAEWSASHHTHKATETLRVCAESARVVSWSVYSGLTLITLYEKHGSSWKSLDRLGSMILTEVSNLNGGIMDPNVWIKLIDVYTGSSLVVDHSDKRNDVEVGQQEELLEDAELTQLEALPLSSNPEGGILEHNAVHRGLTVLLLREEDKLSSDNGLVSVFKKELGIGPASNLSDSLSSFKPPELVMKFGTTRSHSTSLNGFSISSSFGDPAGTLQFDFFSSCGPASFSLFARSLRRGTHN